MEQNVIYVTRNERNKKIKEYASRLWHDSSYTMEKYKQDCDALKIIPLVFHDYPQIKPQTRKLINKHFTEEDTDRDGNYLLRGFYMSGIIDVGKYIAEFGLDDRIYGCSIAGFGGNKKELLVFSWNEGDTTMRLCKSYEEYDSEIRRAVEWWKKDNQ